MSTVDIHNVRLGFANNSSSSHSIVFLKGVKDDYDSDWEFGWEDFTLASKHAKENYLISTIGNSLKERIGEDTAKIILAHLLNRDKNNIRFNGYVDHESVLLIPQEFSGMGVDIEFWNDLTQAIFNEDVVILGGNDNSDGHPLRSKSSGFAIPHLYNGYGEWVGRKDGEVWSLFNRENGNKLRISFSNLNKVVYEKSSLPELVDVKITDFCPYGCEFCYQGSTVKGQHANKWGVAQLAKMLGEAKVFEVALGGGEPTLHPDFIDILTSFRENGVVPNFTTRNLAWLRDDIKRTKILELCGSFAFSTENTQDIDKLVKSLDYHNVNRSRVTIQLVAGAMSEYEFANIIDKCVKQNLNVTLLGFKDTGRGATFKPKCTPEAIWNQVKKIASERYITKIGIDTVFAEQIKDMLKDDKVDDIFYHTKDGIFSCYVDMVTSKMAPSSYCQDDEYVPLSLDSYKHNPLNEFRNTYQKFV